MEFLHSWKKTHAIEKEGNVEADSREGESDRGKSEI